MEVYIKVNEYLMLIFMIINLFNSKEHIDFAYFAFLLNLTIFIETPYFRIIILYILYPLFFNVILKNFSNLNTKDKELFKTCLYWLYFIIFHSSDNYHDWKVKLRLLYKFDYLALYKPILLILLTHFIIHLSLLDFRGKI